MPSATGRRRPGAGCGCTPRTHPEEGRQIGPAVAADNSERQPAHAARPRPRRRGSDAARRRSAAGRRDRDAAGLDRSGARMPGAAATAATAGPPADVVEHWAYVKPVRPALPAVARTAWARTPDRSLRAGAARTRKAARRRRRRQRRRCCAACRSISSACRRRPTSSTRSSPTRRPDAYERVVDRLLASPHYGERWARPWLDLARYADTNGYEKDNRRSIWKYRDWVIDALNARPAVRSVHDRADRRRHAARDADRSDQQKIATGFHRNTMTNEEGGVDPDESLYEVLVDRVNTTATVWLGLDARPARSATTTSTTPSARRTTSGCWPSSPTPTTRRRRPATARATSRAGSISRRPSRRGARARRRPRSTRLERR